eukprot:scaffold200907_cov33-Prasinocladus_malaysianus.AAC.1
MRRAPESRMHIVQRGTSGTAKAGAKQAWSTGRGAAMRMNACVAQPIHRCIRSHQVIEPCTIKSDKVDVCSLFVGIAPTLNHIGILFITL